MQRPASALAFPATRVSGTRQATLRAHSARGFTLIEVVVVLLILGIILGVIGVRLARDPGDIVRDEARRLALVLQNAQQQAILEGRLYAFALTDEGYRFLRLNNENRLVPIEADELLAPRLLPQAMTLAPVRAKTEESDTEQHADLILFDPSGEFPAFTVAFEAAEIVWYVQGMSDGRILSSPTLEAESS